MDSRKINEEYAEIGARLIATEDSLADLRESDVQIIYLSSPHKKVSSGRMVLGQIEKIADKYKWGIPCDFTVTIFERNVAACNFTDEQIRALIHHELMHIGVDREETLIGAEERYYIRPHDMADFKLILQKYGVDWSHSNA